MALKTVAKKLYDATVRSVLPRNLVSKSVQLKENNLVVKDTCYHVNNNVYVIGFGKAVLGMAIGIDSILNKHIVDGVISIPVDLQNSLESSSYAKDYGSLPATSPIKVMGGAKNNLPDEDSLQAAKCIEDFVQRLKQDDILITLVSGGGSALLPAPVTGVSLNEKRNTLKTLAESGASIKELNKIRRKLSRLKGGKLASISGANVIISLIISDIIGNPIDLIASGPTVEDRSTCDECISILDKYKSCLNLPNTMFRVLTSSKDNIDTQAMADFNKKTVSNVLIGTNDDALESCVNEAKQDGFNTFILTNSLSGEARDVGKTLATFIFESVCLDPCIPDYNGLCEDEHQLTKISTCLKSHKGRVCIVAAGETTVTLTGKGEGGRNQELALSASLELNKLLSSHRVRFCVTDDWFAFLSAGTDGQDGPTPAAGAFVVPEIISLSDRFSINPFTSLTNNDSYNFYRNLDGGSYQLVTGLTGTNVMDIQIILVDFENFHSKSCDSNPDRATVMRVKA